MIIVIVTDSLGLPRSSPENVSINETYIEILRNYFPEDKIISLSIGGANIEMLQGQFFNYYLSTKPDLVIIHAGIVDCAPRALKTWETRILTSNKLSNFIYNHVVKKRTIWLRKNRKITYTSLKRFKEIALKIKQELNDNVFWVGIIPSNEEYERQLPGIKENIISYNRQLQEVFSNSYVSMDDIPKKCIMTDHHHINKEGHLFIAKKLIEIIAEKNNH